MQASIRTTLGNVYHRWGEYARAEAHFKRAVDIRKEKLGPEHSDTLDARRQLAMTYIRRNQLKPSNP